MDRESLSAAIIQEMGAVFMTTLAEVLPTLLRSDLACVEQELRQVGRAVLGPVVERVVAAQARSADGGACPACGGVLRCVERARGRRLQGLVGDYTLPRAYYQCVACGQGHVPLDAHLGLGSGSLSPGLARVVCREGLEGAFAGAVDRVEEALGVTLTAAVVRRTTEAMGQVAEAPVQMAMARVARGQRAWTEAEDAVSAPPESGVLAVEVDGLFVHHDDAWHEMKVVTVAPLGPAVEVDPDTDRERLAWGDASYGAGVEEATAFWGRAYVEACRRGLGTPAVHTVVLIADGADWIWRSGRAFLGLPGVEMVEILDPYHVYEYLWMIGNAVFGVGTAAARAWVEPLKTRLYAEGAAPVQAALATLARLLDVGTEPREGESVAATTVRRACAYMREHAARLDYPAFVARAWPIGSGTVESSGKAVVQARVKGAGMRWSTAGAQRVVSLRALHRSRRWDAFWASHPQRTRLHLVPRQRQAHPPVPSPAAAPSETETPPLSVPSPAPPSIPRLLRPAADHPWRRQSLGPPRSA